MTAVSRCSPCIPSCYRSTFVLCRRALARRRACRRFSARVGRAHVRAVCHSQPSAAPAEQPLTSPAGRRIGYVSQVTSQTLAGGRKAIDVTGPDSKESGMTDYRSGSKRSKVKETHSWKQTDGTLFRKLITPIETNRPHTLPGKPSSPHVWERKPSLSPPAGVRFSLASFWARSATGLQRGAGSASRPIRSAVASPNTIQNTPRYFAPQTRRLQCQQDQLGSKSVCWTTYNRNDPPALLR